MKGTEHDVAFFLALGYAPDFTRTVCKNQHGMLAFLGYCVSDRRTTNVKKTKRNASLFYGFFVDFNVISRPGGYPLENVSACKLWREHKNYFCMFLRRPRGGFGTPLEPFWLPWACLGTTLGATWAPKVNIKK